MPKALRYARVLVLVEVTRISGLIDISGIQSGLLPAPAALFGIGDGLVGLAAIPLWYLLGRGRLRTLLLAMAWVTFGLLDAIYAVGYGYLAGQLGAFNMVAPFTIVIPFVIVIQLVTFGLLLTKPVVDYFGRP